VLALASGPGTAIIVVGLFVLYMNAENHLIQPAIVGSAVNLSPPTTMLAALIGGAAAGVPGALVATPVVGAAKQLYFEFSGAGPVEEKKQPSLRERIPWLRRRRGKADGAGSDK
jgi:predicted PurR-regulated permease PerM